MPPRRSTWDAPALAQSTVCASVPYAAGSCALAAEGARVGADCHTRCGWRRSASCQAKRTVDAAADRAGREDGCHSRKAPLDAGSPCVAAATPAWIFLAPALLVLACSSFCRCWRALAMSLTDFDLYALGRLRQSALRGLAQLWPAAARSAVLEGARQYASISWCLACRFPRRVAGCRIAGQFEAGALQERLSHDLLCARGHDAGRSRRGLALHLSYALRVPELCAGLVGYRSHRLDGRSALGHAGDRDSRGVEELRLQHDHPARRSAEHSGGSLRSSADRRCVAAGSCSVM